MPHMMIICRMLSGDHLIYHHIMSNGLKKPLTSVIFNGRSYIRASRHISRDEFLLLPHMVRSVQHQSLPFEHPFGTWRYDWKNDTDVQLKVKVSTLKVSHWFNACFGLSMISSPLLCSAPTEPSYVSPLKQLKFWCILPHSLPKNLF